MHTTTVRIQYKPGNENSNPDVLSRLPLPESPSSEPIPGETVFLMDTLQASPVNATQIRNCTSKDPILAKARTLILQGWTYTPDKDFQPFQLRKEELSVHDGCVLLGSRVVIPEVLRSKMLEQLHQGHPGITRMKALARRFVWWPGMDQQLEQKVRSCVNCQQHQNKPATALYIRGSGQSDPAKSPCRLCWTIFGKNVSNNCRCIFQVDRCSDSEYSHFQEYN